MRNTCNRDRQTKKSKRILFEKLRGRHHLEDLGIDDRMLLERIVYMWVVKIKLDFVRTG
jgi:hypothetical protein